MQKELQGVTELEPNKKPLHLFIGLILLFFGGWAVINGISSITDSKSRLYTPNKSIVVEKVDTPELKYLGLSLREELDSNSGMLFVFETTSDKNCLVMRDMKFSLDMVWLDENKKVINIAVNVEPESYPESFCPSSPAKYALEINAGFASEAEIAPGVSLKF